MHAESQLSSIRWSSFRQAGPYQALKEIFRASSPAANVGTDADVAWRTETVPSTFPLWWGTYVTNGFVGLVAAGLTVSSALKHEPASATAGLLLGISLFLSAMSAASVIAIMRIVHRRQEATSAQLSEAAVAPIT